MWITALFTQLKNELKTNRKKAAILGVLLLVGFWFWIPRTVRMFGGKTKAASAAVTPTVAASNKQNLNQSSQQKNHTEIRSQSALLFDWKQVDTLLKNEPVFQSAEIAELPKHPFQVSSDQFPSPVLPVRKQPVSPSAQQVINNIKPQQRSLEKLILKSTIVGRYHRAALINGRLYDEGTTLRYEKELYTVRTIAPQTVTLQQGDQTWVLKISPRENLPTVQLKWNKKTSHKTAP